MEERYKNEVVPALMERFGYKNIMQVPKIEKVVVSMGVGDAVPTAGHWMRPWKICRSSRARSPW